MVNLVAVFVAAIAGTVIGFLWYSDLLFVKKWMELSKLSPQQLENTNMATAAGMGFGITLAVSFCLAVVYHYCGSTEESLAALMFIIVFVAIDLANALIWEKMPLTLYLIKIGHKVVSWVAILLTYVGIHNMF